MKIRNGSSPSERYCHFLFFPYQCQSISQWQDNHLDTRVGGYQVVEGTNAFGLVVTVVGWIDDVPIPQGIVGKDITAGIQDAHYHLIGLDVGALVAIYKSHVEHNSQFGCFHVGITYAEIYLVGYTGSLYPWSGEIFHLVIDFKGIEFAAFLQTLGQTDGAVTAEGSYFQDVLGTNHFYQHFEQSALDMTARHATVNRMDISGAVKAVEVIAFWLHVVADVLVDAFCLSHIPICLQ